MAQKGDTAQQTLPNKRRAACDECRTKKLKCTGEQPACSRCVRENIACVYSPQKQMGRPKKRQRMGEGNEEEQGHGSLQIEQNQTWSGLDLGGYGSGLAGGDIDGGMQPWILSSGGDDWDFDPQNVPGLTPDTGSNENSPPTLNLPPELQQTQTHHHAHPLTQPSHRDPSTSLLLDPALNTAPPNHLPTCACLSILYLTLSTLQNMPPTFPFPFALHPLRAAMSTASEILACDQCPKSFISSVQNTQLVGTLLTSIAERFARVLECINAEAERAEQADETKKFRLADLNTSTSHLHTNGLGCAAAFTINIPPAEWRSIAKKVVRAEVYGPSDGNHCCPFFLGVTRQFTERQERWHSAEHEIPGDCPRGVDGVVRVGRLLPREEHVCFKLAMFAEGLVGDLDWG